MTFVGVNHWAILVAAIVGWLAGAAWYMTLGKYWRAALRRLRERARCDEREQYCACSRAGPHRYFTPIAPMIAPIRMSTIR